MNWMYFSYSGFLSNLRLPWETELPWNFSLYWIYIFTFRIFEQLVPARKTEFALIFLTVLNLAYFLNSGFFSNLRLPWNFWLHWIYILHSKFLSNLRLPWKTECALKFFTVLNIYFLSFRIFEQLALALKNRVCLEISQCIEILFIIQDFWTTCACLENKVCSGIFHCIEIFCPFWNFEQLALALKFLKRVGLPPSLTTRFVRLCIRLLTLGTLWDVLWVNATE